MNPVYRVTRDINVKAGGLLYQEDIETLHTVYMTPEEKATWERVTTTAPEEPAAEMATPEKTPVKRRSRRTKRARTPFSEWSPIVREDLANNVPAKKTAKKLKVAQSTIYNYRYRLHQLDKQAHAELYRSTYFNSF
jgi:hypothetical protein